MQTTILTQIETIKPVSLNFYNKTPEEGLWDALQFYGIHHAEIVYAQAILETGHFKSNVCKTKNNLFGLKGKNGYYSFNHWSESVKMYKEKIQSRYKNGEDYYSFLVRIRYASNPNYISVVKRIVIHLNQKNRKKFR